MWRTEWNSLSKAIEALKDAGIFHAQNLNGKDIYGVAKAVLQPSTSRIYRNLSEYFSKHRDNVPELAKKSISSFLNGPFSHVFDDKSTNGVDPSSICFNRIIALLAFKAEFDYLLSDQQTIFKRISERAFEHLQRSIVADNSICARWNESFVTGETSCEKLGAAHLLQFGIWAFKASAAGERTDLIFQDVISDLAKVEQTADALVLTEWKVVRRATQVQDVIKQAHSQASLYSTGSLAGIELSKYRYLVIVSEDRVTMPPDNYDSDVIYRHINIAVHPSTPSKPKKTVKREEISS